MMQELTQQQQETLLSLFEHDGWKLFIGEKEDFYKYLKENAHYECPDNDTWQQRRGALATLEMLISFEGTTKVVYDQGRLEEANNGL